MSIFYAMIPAFFWGTTYAVTQFTLEGWPPLLLGALRALPAGLLLLLLRPMWPKGKQWRQLAVLGLINIGIFFSLIFVVALSLPSAISGVGMISVPVFAMIYHGVVYRRMPSKVQMLSGAMLIVLAWMLFDPNQLVLSPIGLGALLTAIFCIIIGSDITKRLGVTMHWWQVLTWQLILGGVFLAIISCIHALVDPSKYLYAIEHVSAFNVAGIAWLSLLNTALGYGLYVFLLQRMSVVEFTFGGIANPIAGIVFGVVLVGESYTLGQYGLMAGMILMSLMPQLTQSIKSARSHQAD
ncbi:multidrug transporter [Vibrio panuliri]|uniref:Multidrug transporter n=1 Tax=Vibrio panuliri TaxID=1381081 RepID=A0A1Q9HRW5_9VIBR|nr:DMT family transporter [Vibrio panuliri]OLQ93575.1 multidrug transporter [Vibrio panuliri]